MGTNFYVQSESFQAHIGKSSAGWRFTFRAYPEKKNILGVIRSARDWREAFRFLREIREPFQIVDEYDHPHSESDFWFMVAVKQRSKMPDEKPTEDSEYEDADGFIMQGRDFS